MEHSNHCQIVFIECADDIIFYNGRPGILVRQYSLNVLVILSAADGGTGMSVIQY
jgi:hypothetical protein